MALESANVSLQTENTSLRSASSEATQVSQAQIVHLQSEIFALQARLGQTDTSLKEAVEGKESHQITYEELELARDNMVSLEAS